MAVDRRPDLGQTADRGQGQLAIFRQFIGQTEDEVDNTLKPADTIISADSKTSSTVWPR